MPRSPRNRSPDSMNASTHPARLKRRIGMIDDPAVERAYRQSVLPQEVRHATFAIAVGIVLILVFLVNDWRLYQGTSRFALLLTLRLAAAAASVAAILAIRWQPNPRRLDLVTSFYLVGLAGMMGAFSALRPPESPTPHFVNAFLVVMFFVGCPGPTRNAAWGAATLGLGAVMLVLVNGPPPDRLAQLTIPTVLLSGGVVGWYFSAAVQSTRRELFLAFLEQRDVNARLIAAREEISTLRGIIPICGHCKRIRDSAGSWRQLEEFISARSEASFSHGICPDCTREHYPEVG